MSLTSQILKLLNDMHSAIGCIYLMCILMAMPAYDCVPVKLHHLLASRRGNCLTSPELLYKHNGMLVALAAKQIQQVL